MGSNASSLRDDRVERIVKYRDQEKEELEREGNLKAGSREYGSFLMAEQRKIYGGAGGLEDRIRRGRAGLVVNGD